MNQKKRLGGIIVFCVICIAWSRVVAGFPGQNGQADQQKATTAAAPPKQMGMVYKTYTLKYIRPEVLLHAAKLFFADATTYANSVTVVIFEGNIPRFEELLNKLDVEKKTIQFQVFAIVASRGRESAIMSKSRKTEESREPATIGRGVGEELKNAEEPVNLKYKEADLRDVLVYLADFAHLNLVLDADVRGAVTCNLQDIPWDQALDIVLRQNRMGKIIEGKVLRIAPLSVLNREQNPEKSDVIENKDLKKVLDELKTLWSFKTYEVDGPSFVTVREDSGPNNFKLVTNRALNLVVSNVKVIGDEAGKRTISIEQLKLTGMMNFADYVFVDTHDVTLKEKGYLVAGVSGYGSASSALILVINAEIK